MMWVIIFIAIIVIYAVVHYTVDAPAFKNLKQEYEKQQADYLTQNGIITSAQYTFKDNYYINDLGWEKSIAVGFVIDKTNEKIVVLSKNRANQILPFSSVCGCEIMIDSAVIGGIGRAVVGGILAGETGALVGAVTAKKHIMSFKVVIYTKDIINPKVELLLINEKKSTKDADYVSAVQFAENVNATIKAIAYNS